MMFVGPNRESGSQISKPGAVLRYALYAEIATKQPRVLDSTGGAKVP